MAGNASRRRPPSTSIALGSGGALGMGRQDLREVAAPPAAPLDRAGASVVLPTSRPRIADAFGDEEGSASSDEEPADLEENITIRVPRAPAGIGRASASGSGSERRSRGRASSDGGRRRDRHPGEPPGAPPVGGDVARGRRHRHDAGASDAAAADDERRRRAAGREQRARGLGGLSEGVPPTRPPRPPRERSRDRRSASSSSASSSGSAAASPGGAGASPSSSAAPAAGGTHRSPRASPRGGGGGPPRGPGGGRRAQTVELVYPVRVLEAARLVPLNLLMGQRVCLPLFAGEGGCTLLVLLVLLASGPTHSAMYVGVAGMLTLSRIQAAVFLFFRHRCEAGTLALATLARDVIVVSTFSLLLSHFVYFVYSLDSYFQGRDWSLTAGQLFLVIVVFYINLGLVLCFAIFFGFVHWGSVKRSSYGVALSACQELTATEEHDGESCAICLEGFGVGERAVQLPCDHMFHRACVKKWMSGGNGCPFRCKPPPRSRSRTPSRAPSSASSQAGSQWTPRSQADSFGHGPPEPFRSTEEVRSEPCRPTPPGGDGGGGSRGVFDGSLIFDDQDIISC